MTARPAHLRRRRRPGPGRLARATAWCGVGLALHGLLACGSPPSATGTAAPPLAINAQPAPPSGPCDGDHQDQAVAAAVAALRRLYGGARLGTPSAEFGQRCCHPQLPGQPVTPPVYGWSVVFPLPTQEPDGQAGASPDARAGLPADAPAPPARPSSIGNPVPGRIAEAPLVASPSAIPVAGPVRPPRSDPQQQGLLMPARPGSAPDPALPQQSRPQVASEVEASAGGPRAVCVFVAVDGTATVL